PRSRRRDLLWNFERLQRRRGAEARAPSSRARHDRHAHQRHRATLLHHPARRRGEARRHSGARASARRPHDRAARSLPGEVGDRRVTIAPKEFDFQAARLRIERKAKAADEKLTSLEDAVSRVRDGDHIAIGGCLYSRTPLALIWALLRRRPRGLTLSRNLMCYEGEWAVVAGAAD